MRFPAALACGLITCGAASATVTLTFDDPGSGPEFTFDSATDTLTFNRAVEFEVDGTEEGITPATFDALFTFTGEVGPATVVATPFGDIAVAAVAGDFAWTEIGSGDLILSGTFTEGLLINSPFGFNLTADDESGLIYTIGEALEDEGYSGISFIPPIDANWTLTNAQFAGPGSGATSEGPDSDEFRSFNANSAFSGTANIPTPGSMALLACGGLVLATRTRRR